MKHFRVRGYDGQRFIYTKSPQYDEFLGIYLFSEPEKEELTRIQGDIQLSSGLNDVNGIEIFEKDILSREVHLYLAGKGFIKTVTERVEVRFDEEYAGFYVGERPLFAELDTEVDVSTKCRCTKFEVIGTSIENPALLELEEN